MSGKIRYIFRRIMRMSFPEFLYRVKWKLKLETYYRIKAGKKFNSNVKYDNLFNNYFAFEKKDKKEKVTLEEVPMPLCGDKHILVKVLYSAISIGTELDSIKSMKQSLFKTAMERKDLVKKALYKAKNLGKNQVVQFIIVDKSLGVIDTSEI